MAHSTSELQVITFAKNLCNYVMTITQKSPKQFRFSLIGRMQGYGKLYCRVMSQYVLRRTTGCETRMRNTSPTLSR